jgi:hypothetical protein
VGYGYLVVQPCEPPVFLIIIVQLLLSAPVESTIDLDTGLTDLSDIKLTTEKTLENWHVLADAVREVIKLCRKGGKGGGTGQIEFQDGWSILYRRAEEGTLC